MGRPPPRVPPCSWLSCQCSGPVNAQRSTASTGRAARAPDGHCARRRGSLWPGRNDAPQASSQKTGRIGDLDQPARGLPGGSERGFDPWQREQLPGWAAVKDLISPVKRLGCNKAAPARDSGGEALSVGRAGEETEPGDVGQHYLMRGFRMSVCTSGGCLGSAHGHRSNAPTDHSSLTR
jgi:hypothetical protein